MSGMRAAAKTCTGSTQTGERCQNTTTHPTGWCGQCSGPPPALAAYAPGAAGASVLVGPGPDPLAGPVDVPTAAAGAATSAASDEHAELIGRLTGLDSIIPLHTKWVERLVGCDECGCLFTIDDEEYLDRFAVNPDSRGNCSANEDCPCHGLPGELPAGIYEATDPATSPGDLRALADSDDLLVLRGVAANPSTPPESLTGLGVPFPGNPTMGDLAVQRAVAGNPSCPAGTLAVLAGERRTADAVAGNPAVCLAAAEAILAAWDDGAAHRALAANSACPPEILARIASDPGIHEATRMTAAANPNCPKSARSAAGLLAG